MRSGVFNEHIAGLFIHLIPVLLSPVRICGSMEDCWSTKNNHPTSGMVTGDRPANAASGWFFHSLLEQGVTVVQKKGDRIESFAA